MNPQVCAVLSAHLGRIQRVSLKNPKVCALLSARAKLGRSTPRPTTLTRKRMRRRRGRRAAGPLRRGPGPRPGRRRAPTAIGRAAGARRRCARGRAARRPPRGCPAGALQHAVCGRAVPGSWLRQRRSRSGHICNVTGTKWEPRHLRHSIYFPVLFVCHDSRNRQREGIKQAHRHTRVPRDRRPTS